MIPYARQFAVLLCPALFLTACGMSSQQRTVQLLDQRLQTRLASEIAAGRAVLQQTHDGALVTLRDPTMFANSADALDNRENDVRASVVEALLDPSLMRVQVTDTSTLPDNQKDARIQNVAQYLVANGLGQTLLPTQAGQAMPTGAMPTGAVPEGLQLTINVQCPDHRENAPYGPSNPMCN